MTINLKEKFLLIQLILVLILKNSNGNLVQASSLPNEANVAVLDCSKKYPNVFYDLIKKEWMVHGADSRCFSTETELLELCKIVYPNFNVVNVMRLEEPVRFTVYGCTGGDPSSKILTLEENEKLKNCSKLKIKRVQPYKCLYGNFQSSELFIPPKCQFQHLYSNDGCQSQDHWNLLSTEKCKSTDSIVNSSMLLQWCDAATSGVSTFSGIEFVCCPKQQQQQQQQQVDQKTSIEDEDIDDDGLDEDQNEENDDDDDEQTVQDQENNIDQNSDDLDAVGDNDNTFKLNPEQNLIGGEEKKINNNDDYDYNKIVDNSINNLNSNDATLKIKAIIENIDLSKLEQNDMEAVEGTKEQKEQYEKQKKFILTSIQTSLDNLVKEKENSRKFLNNKKGNKVNEKVLENLNVQFEIRMNRLNIEKNRLLLQEELSFEQQVQGRINENKLNKIKDLNRVMQEQVDAKEKNLDLIIKSLFEFFVAQESDRLHMVTVYKKLQAYFPEQLTERGQSIINHLESIDKAINETVSVFKTKFSDSADIILPALKNKLKRYEPIRSDMKIIIDDLKSTKPIDQLKQTNEIRLDTTKETKLVKIDSDDVNDDDINQKQSPNYNYDDEAESNEPQENEKSSFDDSDESDESSDSDNDLIKDDQSKQLSNNNIKQSTIEEAINNSINIKRLKNSDSNLSKLCIIIGICLSVFSSLIFIFAMIRRKRIRNQHLIKHGFVPVDTQNPEDRHVNNMQINGYENPTYKFFENNVQA